MYAYRMGGDEFLVIVNDADESVVIQTVDTFKEAMKLNKYHCSVGYAMRRGVGTDLELTMREAEKNMYSLKDFYYKNSTAERRTH